MALQTKSISANGSKGHHKFTLTLTENSTSVENNNSPVSWSLVLSSLGGGYDWNYSNTVPVTYSVVVNGKTHTGNIMKYDGKSTVTVASGTETITHNDDGNKTISFSFSISSLNQSYLPGSASASGSMALTFIARASQPSLITYPENTQNVGDFGATISIHMNRKSDKFTHTVRYEFGDLSGTCINADTGKAATGIETGFKWKIPESFMNEIPANVSGSGKIYVDTYNGSTKIGTKYSGFTATVPASVKPTVSMTLEDVTGVDDIYGSPVKGLSKIKITVNATTAYSSQIASYQITANGVKYSTKEATTGFLTTAGDSVVTVTATDKRGRKNSDSYTMNVQDYTPPAVSALSAIRCNKNGSVNKRGEYIRVTFSAVISSMGNKNTASYSVEYKKTTDAAFTNLETDVNGNKPSNLNNTFAPSKQSFVFAANIGNSYDVVVVATDRHKPADKSTKAPTAAAIFSWRGFKNSSGNKEEGAGIGKVPEKPNVLQVGWNAEFDKDVAIMGNQYCFSSSGTDGKDGFVKIARLTHKNPNVDTPITFVFTRRLESSPMTVHVQFKTDSTTTDPDLKNITYEGSNYGAFLVKAQESVWDLYVQKSTANDRITLQSWFSSESIRTRLTVEFPGDLVDSVPQGLVGYYRATPAVLQNILDCFMPVGFVLTLYTHTDPNTMYPGTSWTRITDAFLWATDSTGIIGQRGGEKTHTLTTDEMPSHSHIISVANTETGTTSGNNKIRYNNNATSYVGKIASETTGEGAAHNNMPPYIQVSMWRRTA